MQLILWHTDSDSFEDGQWFHGVLDGWDLSPNGRLFIYHAIKYQWEDHNNPEKLHRWTVISKPPYLTALALWQNYPYGWAGGYFLDNHRIQVGRAERPTMDCVPRGKGFKVVNLNDWKAWEAAYHDALLRRGWKVVQDRIWKFPPGRPVQSAVWSKDGPQGRFSILRSGERTRELQYSLLNNDTRKRTTFQSATWMDWDQRGRLVYAEAGKLLTIDPTSDLEPQVLADFTSHQFSELVAPEWAQHW